MAEAGQGLRLLPVEKEQPPVLIDTPVWQEYFRREELIFPAVNGLMDAGRVCSLDLIVAELLLSAPTAKEMKIFQDFTRVFPILHEFPGAWVKSALLAFKLRQKGKDLSLRDGYVVLMAQSHDAMLYTLNPTVHQARRVLPRGLKFFSNGRTF